MQVGQWYFPDQLWYTREHLWLKVEGQVAAVGLTDYAQDTRGDVLYLGLPKDGLQVSRGDSIASIETGKWVGRICSPVSGTIVEVNQRLSGEPQLINKSPYEEGWIYRIQLAGPEETDGFFQGEKFFQWLAAEIAAAGDR
ncbi:MAG: glycine cleavage system protein H [Clostridia bacterium]|nr:glycine cleavage system protein H [Clostridia bacterium]